MNYYVIKPQVEDRFLYIEDEDISFPPEFSGKNFLGNHIPNKYDITLKNRNKVSEKTDFIAGPVILPIISYRFMQLIEEFENDNVQFWQVNLHNSFDDEVDKSFYHMYLINNVDALDVNKSTFCVLYRDSNGIRKRVNNEEFDFKINKWRIRDSKEIILNDSVGNRTIFRVNRINSLIIINEHLKNKIEEAGLIGIDIQPLETYPYGHF